MPKYRYLNSLCSTIETVQNHKCSIIWTFHTTYLTCSRFGQILKGHVNKHDLTIHQLDLCFFHGSRPVEQIGQISYICFLEKNFGKPQNDCSIHINKNTLILLFSYQSLEDTSLKFHVQLFEAWSLLWETYT